jgi:hypothetical protein
MTENGRTYVHSERRNTADPMRAWVELVSILALLWVVMFVAIPAAQRLPYMAPTVGALLDSGIEVSALYYTGVEKVSEAEAAVRAAANRSRP